MLLKDLLACVYVRAVGYFLISCVLVNPLVISLIARQELGGLPLGFDDLSDARDDLPSLMGPDLLLEVVIGFREGVVGMEGVVGVGGGVVGEGEAFGGLVDAFEGGGAGHTVDCLLVGFDIEDALLVMIEGGLLVD